ncbi:MAG: aldo/keto reductase [Candidatus Lokiarchaeota archaeon]|nr:aldo/keto reductase [Candidatus Lokiarchaeota archaeon]MBD3200948.1 aldo/keto reductase [Candidatus Lokiarchaeota archaeon]
MEYRKFGHIEHDISVLTLGGWGVGHIKKKEADKFIQKAFDIGINSIDVAPTYGRAEKRLAPWIDQYRDVIFLAEKTESRTKIGAWEELQNSLETLNTDYFDLYQFHAVNNKQDLELIFNKGGAIEAFEEARDSDIIKNIGITGHTDIQILIDGLKRYDFDSVLCPVYLGAMVNPDPVNDFRPLLSLALEKNIGVIAIKSIAKGRWKSKNKYKTWYEPIDDPDLIKDAIQFTLNQKGVSSYSISGETTLWSYIFDAVQDLSEYNKEKESKLIEKATNNGIKPLFSE